ncbi:hypothetical protein SB725_30110, partial [Pseudomonas sp. SIMBA_041]|uniref:hypothetical protein n=1 Tax=Pseudomonas sp. SIMBA_041 TaxID=3085782 RepID=UPI00397E35C6
MPNQKPGCIVFEGLRTSVGICDADRLAGRTHIVRDALTKRVLTHNRQTERIKSGSRRFAGT